MADESNWQYEVDSPQRGGHTAAFNRRRYGEVLSEQETKAYVENGARDSEEAPARPSGDWEDRFSTRHLPDGQTYEERTSEELSPREQLLRESGFEP